MHFRYKYQKVNSGKFDRTRSTYGPPGIPRLYHYSMSRKDTCLDAFNSPLDSLDAGGDFELSSPPMKGCYSDDHRRASTKSKHPSEVISRGSISRRFTTLLSSDGWTSAKFPLQPDHKTESNFFNFGEAIITRREYHGFKGGEV